MSVISIDIKKREPYANGRRFGSYGPIERVEGVLSYAVDPNDAHNQGIVDIELAPTDEEGKVHFQGEFTLIAPTEVSPRCLLVEVPNRGRHIAYGSFNRARPAELLDDPCAAGDGFLFRHGFAVLAVGWQFDAIGMRLDVPEALDGDDRIRGQVICQMQPGRDVRSLAIGQLGPVAYKPSENHKNQAVLYERERPMSTPAAITRNRWRFGRFKGEQFEHSNRHITLEGSFQAGTIYSLVYEAEGAYVVGLGLLALRDAGAFFKSSRFSWNGKPPVHALAYGASQTGRVLRHLLYLGLNESESGEEVYDGLLPHIAGGQRGDFNHRFAQPSTVGIPSHGQTFPFAGRTLKDPLSGVTDGLLARSSSSTKVIATNTSWEYWRGDAALSHTSPDGSADCEPMPNERSYFFAGTHHINAVLPSSERFYLTNERVGYPMNMVSFTPLLRAALINLRDWVEGKREPPISRIPQIANGTLVSRVEVIRAFEESGAFDRLVNPDALPSLFVADLGDQADAGICEHPAKQGSPYASLVAAVADDLNEIAGIRLPEVELSIGIHTGWNPRHEAHGAPDQLATFAGFSVFDRLSSATDSESLEARIEAVSQQLVAEHLVLTEDHELVVGNARRLLEERSRATLPEAGDA